MEALISVVIPTLNRCEHVLRAVRSVLRQDYVASGYEIIVVVDGGTDNTAHALQSVNEASRIRVIELPESRGAPAARNAGLQIAAGELLVFLDDDMVCVPGWLSAHVSAHETFGENDAVGMGGIYLSEESSSNLAAEYFLEGLGAEFLKHREFPDSPWPANVWSFGNTSVKRSLLRRVGDFDERFRLREDSELGVRLLKSGVRQRFIPDAVAYQSCVKSVRELVRDSEKFADYDLLFLRTHPGWTPHDFVTHLREEGAWKRWIRRGLAQHLAIADLFLAPLCAMGEWRQAPGLLRKVALRALQFRCGLHWYRRLREISGSDAEVIEESRA